LIIVRRLSWGMKLTILWLVPAIQRPPGLRVSICSQTSRSTSTGGSLDERPSDFDVPEKSQAVRIPFFVFAVVDSGRIHRSNTLHSHLKKHVDGITSLAVGVEHSGNLGFSRRRQFVS